jgi:parvulin-like peptidyl-prolyl isomerase
MSVDTSLQRISSVALLALVLPAWSGPGHAVEVNRVVLRVNDRIATLYDYEERRDERLAVLARAPLSEAEKQQRLAGLGEAVMRELFDELLLLSRADQLGLRAEESDIQAMVEQTKKSFGISDDEEFEQALAANGMTRESFRRQMERNLLIRQTLGREVYSDISVEEEDARRYYRENPQEFTRPARRRLREVVILEEAVGDGEMTAVASDLRGEILAGRGEEAVAERQQEGVSTGWIELGWVEMGDLDPELEDALADLGPGGVSEPTVGRGGLHVLEVLEFEDAALVEFAEVADAIKARIRDELFEDTLGTYMSELEEGAYVQSDPPPDAAGFRSRASGPRPRVDPLERQMAAQKAVEERAADEASAEPTEDSAPEPPEDAPPPPPEG